MQSNAPAAVQLVVSEPHTLTRLRIVIGRGKDGHRRRGLRLATEARGAESTALRQDRLRWMPRIQPVSMAVRTPTRIGTPTRTLVPGRPEAAAPGGGDLTASRRCECGTCSPAAAPALSAARVAGLRCLRLPVAQCARTWAPPATRASRTRAGFKLAPWHAAVRRSCQWLLRGAGGSWPAAYQPGPAQ